MTCFSFVVISQNDNANIVYVHQQWEIIKVK